MGVGTQERLILALALDWCSRQGSNPCTPTKLEDDMTVKIEMCVGEIMDLAAWLERNGLDRTHHVVIEQDSGSGIGTATQARVEMTKTEGIFINLTDYDMW